MSRAIVHLDADAFYAAVEQAADSRLRGKAIAVGGEKRGIIASASYEARKFGVYTPMPTSQARRLCPKLIVLPGDFERYEQFSRWMFSYPQDFTPDVEITSVDEGYFDLTATGKPAHEIARKVRDTIRQSLKLNVSEGIGSNKLVSQIAAKLHKPAAFQEVPAGQEAAFLSPLPNKWLPGVGPKTSARLTTAGLADIAHIADTPVDLLELIVGSQALALRQFARGIDDRPVITSRGVAKSFGEQQTFMADVTDEGYAEATLRRMADNLFARVRAEGHTIRTLTVKVRYNDLAEDQCGESLREPTALETDVYGRLGIMLRQAWRRRVSLRLVSLKLSNVHCGRFSVELPLEADARRQEAHERLAHIVDRLRKTHGRGVILRGHDFRLREAPLTNLEAPPVAAAPLPRRLVVRVAPTKVRAVPLHVHSHCTFLDSTLSPTAIVGLAVKHECPAVALTDVGNLHGAAEFAQAAKVAGIKPVFGAELRVGAHTLLAYVESAKGYANLCRLLSQRKAAVSDESVATQQGMPLKLSELDGRTEGLLAVSDDVSLASLFPGRFYEAATTKPASGCFKLVACSPVHYGTPGDRLHYDLVQSIRTRTLLRQEHPEKRVGGALHLRTPRELALKYAGRPEVLAHSLELAERCDFTFPEGAPQFPDFKPPDGSSPRAFLRKLVLAGLHDRYKDRAGQFKAQVEEELRIIAEVGYEGYFLLVWELLQTCREKGIEWITRGSAADSLVCYCLRISDVCPIRFDLYFKRFLNRERMSQNKLPDIDIDFAHDVKDDVVKMLFERHGPKNCAIVGGFSTFQARAAFGDVAKVLGVAEREVRRFTERFPWGFGGGWQADDSGPNDGARLSDLLAASPECRDLPVNEEPFKTALGLTECLEGVPRNPKMHPCGVVLSRDPIHTLTPTFISAKGYPTTHLDMDAVEQVGLVKLDVLAQGGLAVLRDAKKSLAARGIGVDFNSFTPWDDPAVWHMIAGGGARAVHHIESPAMTSLCQMMNVSEIDGVIGLVAVIRPGAANEGKKLGFTRRYQGLEPTTYPHPSLEPCLRSTYGLVVFEEHVLQICETFAGLSLDWGDKLRRALNRSQHGKIKEIKAPFTESARKQGHSPEEIAEVWELVSNFTGYTFNKAHSTAYGIEAYWGAWMKHYYPAEFLAAVLTHGKGFYPALVYVLEARRLGLSFLPPSVNEPGPAFTAHGQAIRVPLMRAKGLTERTTKALEAERARAPFASLADVFHRVRPGPEELEAMIRVGAFDEFGPPRTAQFWEAQWLHQSFHGTGDAGQGWLLAPPGMERLPEVSLREPTRAERLAAEDELFGYPVSGHPLELYADVAWDTYCPVSRFKEHIGEEVVTCGLVVEQRTHHQITGEPMKFLTLADWTGMVESELFADTYRSHGLATVRYPVLEVTAKVEPFENGNGFTLRVLRAGKPRHTADQPVPLRRSGSPGRPASAKKAAVISPWPAPGQYVLQSEAGQR